MSMTRRLLRAFIWGALFDCYVPGQCFWAEYLGPVTKSDKRPRGAPNSVPWKTQKKGFPPDNPTRVASCLYRPRARREINLGEDRREHARSPSRGTRRGGARRSTGRCIEDNAPSRSPVVAAPGRPNRRAQRGSLSLRSDNALRSPVSAVQSARKVTTPSASA